MQNPASCHREPPEPNAAGDGWECGEQMPLSHPFEAEGPGHLSTSAPTIIGSGCSPGRGLGWGWGEEGGLTGLLVRALVARGRHRGAGHCELGQRA